MDVSEEFELIRRAAQGDRMAAQTLIETLSPPLYRLAYRMIGDASEAEDMVQDCFMRLWPKLKSWRSEAHLSTWLHRVMVNRCIDHKRKFRPTPSEILEDTLPQTQTSEDALGRKQDWAIIENGLAKLPSKQSTAINLCSIEGYSQKEAAKILNLSERALESLLARARRSLKSYLSEAKTKEANYG